MRTLHVLIIWLTISYYIVMMTFFIVEVSK